MQGAVAYIAAVALLAWAAPEASAQTANVNARIGAGQTVRVTATPVPNEGVLLEILLPGGQTQSFPRLGTELVPIDGRPGGNGLLVRDLNGDGVDEVVIRGSVPPERGAMLIFRWNRTVGEYVPVEFTDDNDRTTKYLVVDAKEPVLIDGAGNIEVQYEAVRPDGRKSSHVARYRWDGKSYMQSTDN